MSWIQSTNGGRSSSAQTMIRRERTLPPEYIYPVDEWKIVKRLFESRFVSQDETIFSTANGYLGMRGTYEEGEPVVHNPNPEDNQKSSDAELSSSVSPLAVPILAGPGTITTAMNFVSQGELEQHLTVFMAFSLLCTMACLFLFLAAGW